MIAGSKLIRRGLPVATLAISCLMTAVVARSQETAVIRFEVRVPDVNEPNAAAEQAVFLAGDHAQLGQWKPDGLKLNRAEDGSFYVELTLPIGSSVQFKCTRGSWQTVEKDKSGGDIPNRRIQVQPPDDGSKQTIQLTVERWGGPQRLASTVTGTLKFHKDLASQHLPRSRRIGVWLPSEYDRSGKRYPVLYLQDGQNLFDAATAAFGREWQADETASTLIETHAIPPIIIVGIWNTPDRIDEYTLTQDSSLSRGGRGADYIRFVTEELKPFIDGTYRTRPERESTFIGGSSLGALISIHACLAKPDVFGGCLAFSPSLGWDNERLLTSWHEDTWPPEARLWLSMGQREGRNLEAHTANITRARKLHELLVKSRPDSRRRVHFQEYEEGTHDEHSWATQLPDALKACFSEQVEGPGRSNP